VRSGRARLGKLWCGEVRSGTVRYGVDSFSHIAVVRWDMVGSGEVGRGKVR